MSGAGPIRVATIDIERPITDLDCVREASPPYAAAWILACRAGRPLECIEIPVAGGRIPATELERALAAHIGRAVPAAPHEQDPVLPPATVIVPTCYARPAQLERCLDSLRGLDYPDYEVIVVDNRGRPTPPLDSAGVRVVHEPRPGGSAARNRGLAFAAGEIVAFTDDDVEVDRNWLRALGARFARQPEVAAVTGLVLPRELETPAQVLFEQSGSGPDRCFSPLTFEHAGGFRVRRRDMQDGGEELRSIYATGELGIGSNMAFRAQALRALGGFDNALGPGTVARAGEELALFLELLVRGHKLGYEPSAIAHHTHRETFPELERQIHSYGIGFTAMLTAISSRNPRHLLGLAEVAPAWLRSLRDPGSAKRARRSPDYPASLVRAELRGMLVGPVAYLRSRRMQRRWAA